MRIVNTAHIIKIFSLEQSILYIHVHLYLLKLLSLLKAFSIRFTDQQQQQQQQQNN